LGLPIAAPIGTMIYLSFKHLFPADLTVQAGRRVP
jgi:hypothetical protein